MARRDEGGGHPIFWLLLGFFCGVVGTLGALLLLSSEVTGTSGPPAEAVEIGEPPALDGAAPTTSPAAGPPVAQSQTPAAAPATSPAATPAAPTGPSPTATQRRPNTPSEDAQIADDAAASGMTARRR